jgi:pimeloyl-ACP methyl ester carboxylesterase
MPMLAAQRDSFRSVLLKQRGVDKLAVVGHSWGANLALHYAGAHPEHLDGLVLIGLGPIDDEMSRYYRGSRDKMVPPDQLERFRRVRQQFRHEFASGRGVSEATDRENAEVHSHVCAYTPEKAREIWRQYLEAGGFRRRYGHYPWLDQPDRFFRILDEFIHREDSQRVQTQEDK